MKKLLLICFVILAFSISFAQNVITKPVETSDDIARVITSATSELLLVTDTFRNEALADAVREALEKRGVQVYVLVSKPLVNDLSSYFGTLERAGAEIRLQDSTGAFLVVDRTYVIQGKLLSTLPTTQQTTPTMLIASKEYADYLTELFIEAFEGAVTWTHDAQ
jgi:phosphatidylserine/phosphatidylglycerophosphate/cardiolipin synthase-like enzyme